VEFYNSKKKSEEEPSACPKCGISVSKDDGFCKKCGAKLHEDLLSKSYKAELLKKLKTEPPYKRKLTLLQRISKLLTSPSEAMQDISLAPDYFGVVVIIILETVIAGAGVALALQKIQLTGPNASTVMGMLGSILMLTVLLVPFIIAIRWFFKSWLVKMGCDNESSWDFETAASVTGYAYLADVVIGVVGLFILWLFLPTLSIDTSNLEIATQQIEAFKAQTAWLQLVFTLPASLIGVAWKSYLGGLGAHTGTRKKCSVQQGFAVFIVLGLIGLAISFLS
jgi:hypothetical protein